jgi:hypothetical protein
MKLYVSPNLTQVSNVTAYLSSIGVETTTSLDDTGVDNFVTLRNPDPSLPLASLSEVQAYVGTYKLNAADYLNSKFGLAGSHKLNNKWELQQALSALNLPRIETVYPTSEQDIIDFFAAQGTVFCKPAMYHSSIDPELDLTAQVKNYQADDKAGLATYLSSIPVPESSAHFYKSFSTYAEFSAAVDVENFLTIQNSATSLPIHQCILQKDITVTTPTWNHFIVLGYVNGSNQIIHDAYIIMPRTNDTSDDTIYNNDVNLINRSAKTKVSFDFNSFSEADLITMLSNRNIQGSDPYNVEAVLEPLFAQANTRNTYFTVQGYINDDNQPVVFDVSTGKMSPALRRAWITPEQQLNRLKFMSDEAHDATKLAVDTYRFWFEVRVASGATLEQLQAASAHKVCFMLPVRPGFVRIPCTAYGDTPAEVAANVKSYFALFNT